jgi:hypothetical protein
MDKKMFLIFEESNKIPPDLQAEIDRMEFDGGDKTELEKFVKFIILENNLINIILKPDDDIHYHTISELCRLLQQQNIRYVLDTYMSAELIRITRKDVIPIARMRNSLINKAASLVKIKVSSTDNNAFQVILGRVEERKWRHYFEKDKWIWIAINETKPIYIKFQAIYLDKPPTKIRELCVLPEAELFGRMNEDIAEAESFIRMNSLKNFRDSYYRALVTFPEVLSKKSNERK